VIARETRTFVGLTVQMTNGPDIQHRVPGRGALRVVVTGLDTQRIAVTDLVDVVAVFGVAVSVIGTKAIVIQLGLRMMVRRIAGPAPGQIDDFADDQAPRVAGIATVEVRANGAVCGVASALAATTIDERIIGPENPRLEAISARRQNPNQLRGAEGVHAQSRARRSRRDHPELFERISACGLHARPATEVEHDVAMQQQERALGVHRVGPALLGCQTNRSQPHAHVRVVEGHELGESGLHRAGRPPRAPSDPSAHPTVDARSEPRAQPRFALAPALRSFHPGAVPSRYHIATYGCRVNQADSAALAQRLDAESWDRVGDERDADVVVVNTCTVTHRSDADVRKAVHRIRRTNPAAKVVVTGCMAQRVPDELVQLGGVRGVLGNDKKHEVAAFVDRVDRTTSSAVEVHRGGFDPNELPPVDPVADVLDRSRPFLKVQDGCDAFCTYCIIPEVRGPARSAPFAPIVERVEKLIAQGHFEIVLTGVHLGTYRDADGRDLGALVKHLLDLPGLGRLRMSCIEPMAVPPALLDLIGSHPKLAPHFHLPLQSGADRVLKRMVRPYRAADWIDLLRSIRSRAPGTCLGTDVIVGFPGESEADFRATLRAVEAAELDYVHAFSYSDRARTPSTRLGPKNDPKTIKDRTGRLNAWSRQAWHRFMDRQIGAVLDAVTLESPGEAAGPDRTRAVADNYAPLSVRAAPCTRPAPNRPLRCRVQARAGRFLDAVACPV